MAANPSAAHLRAQRYRGVGALRFSALAGVIAAMVACTGLDEKQIEVEEALRDEMVEHRVDADSMRDALIQGDLTTARLRAAKLRDTFVGEGLGPEVVPLVTEIKAQLGVVAEAGDLTAASEAAGQVAQTCGRCHSATGGGPEKVASEPPPTGGIPEEMARHQWAAERMWLGLVTHDAALFGQAVGALAESPLVPPAGDKPLPELATELEAGVHELAKGAAAADTPEARGKAYGDMLVTCATCHALLRDAPKE